MERASVTDFDAQTKPYIPHTRALKLKYTWEWSKEGNTSGPSKHASRLRERRARMPKNIAILRRLNALFQPWRDDESGSG